MATLVHRSPFIMGMLSVANIVWPTLIFAGGLWTWWAILGGFLIELPFVMWASGRDWRSALVLTLVANLATATIGLIALSIFDFAWAIVSLGLGTFSLTTYVVSYLGYTCITAGAEAGIVALDSRRQKRAGARYIFLKMLLANALSVALAFGAMSRSPNAYGLLPPWGNGERAVGEPSPR